MGMGVVIRIFVAAVFICPMPDGIITIASQAAEVLATALRLYLRRDGHCEVREVIRDKDERRIWGRNMEKN